MERPMWWLLSFADEKQFLGVVLIDAPTLNDAIQATWKAKCNPGGSCRGTMLPVLDVDSAWANRVLTREEVMLWEEGITA